MAADRAVRKTTESEEPRRLTTAQARDRLPMLALEAALAGTPTVLTRRETPLAVLIGWKRYEELVQLEARTKR